MTAVCCTGLPVAGSLSVDSTSTCPKATHGVTTCVQTSRRKTTGLSDGNINSLKISCYRNEEKSRRRLDVVQQAAPPTLSLNPLETVDVSGTKTFFWLDPATFRVI